MTLESLLGRINDLLWGHALVYLLVGAGLWFTWITRGVQFRQFGRMWRLVLRPEANQGEVSSFQAFCIGLSSRVGTGNIAGVALAITLGGPGAIFWMWCIATLGMATAFVEATLAQIYKVRQPDGGFRGGPAFYIRDGMRAPALAWVYALLFILTFGLVFNAVQANTIAAVFQSTGLLSPGTTAALLVFLAAPVLLGGLRAVARVSAVVLPVMALLYLGMAGLIMAMHADRLPDVLGLIVRDAFGLAPASAGLTGSVAAALLNGTKRGLFSNEAGMGSAPNAAAAAATPHPANQGLVQSLGVFFDTMLVCSATAFIILLSGLPLGTGEGFLTGAELTQAAVSTSLGEPGRWLMTLLVFLFAFSSVLGGYAYIEGNLLFLGGRTRTLLAFKALTLMALVVGCLIELRLAWTLADVAMGLIVLVNVAALMKLAPVARAALDDFEAAQTCGQPARFHRRSVPSITHQLQGQAWPEGSDRQP